MQAADAATMRTALGLGTIATQAASAVAITGGTILGLTNLGVSMANNTAMTGFALGTLSDTTSRPLNVTQTWNNGSGVFTLATLNATTTALAAGSKLLDWQASGVSQLSIGYNTTGSTEASPWRLVFGSSASIGWAAGWSAVSLRNAANSGDVNFRASLIQGAIGVFGTNYIAIGSGNEGDAGLSSASWRGAGLRLRDTASIVWTSTSVVSGADRNFIRSGSGSPEAVVTANVGSAWLRTDGGASTTLYVKESGTGNTGWVAK
jgi:hypothetical protein